MLTCNETLWARRNHGGQINFQPGSQLPHLERLVTGSRITIHSFTSPYLQKYSFNPSGRHNKVERRRCYSVNQEVNKKWQLFNRNLARSSGCRESNSPPPPLLRFPSPGFMHFSVKRVKHKITCDRDSKKRESTLQLKFLIPSQTKLISPFFFFLHELLRVTPSFYGGSEWVHSFIFKTQKTNKQFQRKQTETLRNTAFQISFY